MTNKEKAKAYDEALERARQLNADNMLSNETIEEIFPQLVENEDEKIRQAIIALVQWAEYFSASGITREDAETMLAWLEKQKDRLAPIYKDIDSFESALGKAWKDYNDSGARIVDGCEDDYVECAHAKGFREGYLFGIEKQKEQKPADEDRYMEGYINGKNNALKELKPIKWDELTWEDINDLESIMNQVHSDFRYGIGEKNFGLEVLERFRYNKGDEYLDAIAPKFKVGDEICSVDGQYEDTVLEVLSDGSYRLKNLGILSIPESEWRLVNAPVDGYELIDKQQSTEQKPAEQNTRAKIISRATSEKQVVLVSESDNNAEIGWDTRSLEEAKNLLEYGISFINKQLGVKPAELIPMSKDCKPTEWSEKKEFISDMISERLKSIQPQPHTVSIKDATNFGNLEYERGVKDGIQSEKSRHWKPSEEQMRAVFDASERNDKLGSVLRNLYGDLKKL